MISENAKDVRMGMLASPRALVVYLVGLVLVYVGERLIGGQGAIRWIVSGTGMLSLPGPTFASSPRAIPRKPPAATACPRRW